MTTEYWLFVIFGAVLVLALGFFVGRRSAPTQQRLDAVEQQRDEALQEADRVRSEVARHFEQSARMFGRLADDYRSFFEHFAETAQHLGLSEGRARELLRQADPRLVANQSAAGDSGGAESEVVPTTPADGATAPDATAPADAGEPGVEESAARDSRESGPGEAVTRAAEAVQPAGDAVADEEAAPADEEERVRREEPA